MAKVYCEPEGMEAPEFGDYFTDGRYEGDDYRKACDEHAESIAELCRQNGTSDLLGQRVRFQIADGYAEYMVWSTSPLSLIHLNYVDGYQIPDAHARGLRVSDIRERVKSEAALRALFSEAGDDSE